MFYIYLFKLNLILKNYNIFLRCSPNFSDNKTIVYVGWPWPDVVKTELPETNKFFMRCTFKFLSTTIFASALL